MAMSLPLVTSGGVRRWRAASNDGAFPERDLVGSSSWPHQECRLWASMPEAFWMYEFKVQQCQQLSSHDWTLCPYAHRGERARRRYPYLGVMCPEYRASQHYHLAERTGEEPTCVRGLTCRYAHGVFEVWLHPDCFRTSMCDAGPRCQRRICFFAHCPTELRSEGGAVLFVSIAMVPPPIQYPPPPPPCPRLRIVDAPVSSLPRHDMVLLTRSGDKLPLNGGDVCASSSSSTASVATQIDINGSSSTGSSSSGSGRAFQDSDSKDDLSDLDFFILDMVNKLVT